MRIGSPHAAQDMKHMQKLALFCSWLKQHAGLVGSIRFDGSTMACTYTESSDSFDDAAEQLLALGLQEAAAAPSAAAPSAAAPMRSALQLRSCSIDCIRSPVLLLALPASLRIWV
jgi:hypothetical protein